ncbi:MAG TPA: DUF2231 domain-containing protein [Candidatus Acidoferrales bacterium]|nr:DUF2231 domain-containing protein [Candidatus Acidoferrales bacterium]
MDALFPGLKGMLNYHPLFVHFPIGMWTAALLFELAARLAKNDALHRIACGVLTLGALAAIPTVVSGWSAESAVPRSGAAHDAKELHETLMVTSSILSGVLAALGLFVLPRKPTALLRSTFLIGLLLLVGMMFVGADRGALLVYHYGTSVDWAAAKQQK